MQGEVSSIDVAVIQFFWAIKQASLRMASSNHWTLSSLAKKHTNKI